MSEKLLFRMQHIVPQNLKASSEFGDSVVGPEEVEFPMTWGKVAGIALFFDLLVFSFNLSVFI